MKNALLSGIFCVLLFCAGAQSLDCNFKQPVITIHFGSGNDLHDINTAAELNYDRVGSYCPTDGHYSYTSYTSDCFRGDWLTLEEDHTPGDNEGNMMLVNASYSSGVFFGTQLSGLKGGVTYEFSQWMMNVCRISEKCPYPLLPNIAVRLKTPAGRTVAQFSTGEVQRLYTPHWTKYRAMFTMPVGETALLLTMEDMAPGGCGNDFVLDDIAIRECRSIPPAAIVERKKVPSIKKTPAAEKKVAKKAAPAPVKRNITVVAPSAKPTPAPATIDGAPKYKPAAFPPPPAILTTRANPLIKQIETGSGEITVNLYDNGEIDGDTVSVYHNNELVISRAKLSQKPIAIRLSVNAAHPHHELIMVAHNLGSIPPNTSLMIVTTATKKHQIFISSTEQKNAKITIDLRE